MEDVVGEESRRREVLLPEAATLQDVADDGRGQSGHIGRSGTRIFLQPEVLKEVGSIDALLGINCEMFTLAETEDRSNLIKKKGEIKPPTCCSGEAFRLVG